MESGPVYPQRVGRAAALARSHSSPLLLPALSHQCGSLVLSDCKWEGLLSLGNGNLERKTWEKVEVLSAAAGRPVEPTLGFLACSGTADTDAGSHPEGTMGNALPSHEARAGLSLMQHHMPVTGGRRSKPSGLR